MKFKTPKIGIVVTGGGSRCAFGAGALYALHKKYKFDTPHALVGASGSTGSVMYYASRQFEAVKDGWMKILPDNNIISFFRYPFLDIKRLVSIIKQSHPFDLKTLWRTKTKYFIPLTNIVTGKHHFFSHKDGIHPYDLLHAGKAMPIAYNDSIMFNGAPHIDGATTASTQDLVTQAVATDPTHIILIRSSVHKNFLAKALFWFYGQSVNKNLRKAVYDGYFYEPEVTVPPHIKLIDIKPSMDPPAGIMSLYKENIVKTFKLGFDDLIANKQVKKLMDFTQKARAQKKLYGTH